MKKSLSILKNLYSITSAELISRLASYYYTIHIMYVLGVDGVGLIAIALSFSEVFVAIISNGLDSYSVNEIAKEKNNPEKRISTLLSLKLLLAVVSYLSLLIVVLFIDKPESEITLILIAGIHIFGRGINGKWIYQGLERMNVITARQIISSVLLITLTIFLVNRPEDLVLALIIQVAVEIINTTLTILYYLKEGFKLHLFKDKRLLFENFKKAIPFGAVFIFIALYNSVDKLMLYYLRADYEYLNGILHGSAKLMIIMLVPTGILQNVFFPRFSGTNVPAEREKLYSDYSRILFSIGSICMGLILFYPEVSMIIYPNTFNEVIDLLPYHGVVVGIIYIVSMFTFPLLAWGKQSKLAIATLLALLVNIILNYVLIPEYGVYGALEATIASEFAILIFSLVIFLRLSIKIPLKYPFITYSTSLLVFWISSNSLLSEFNLIFAIVITVAVNILLLYVFRVIDIDLFKKLSKT